LIYAAPMAHSKAEKFHAVNSLEPHALQLEDDARSVVQHPLDAGAAGHEMPPRQELLPPIGRAPNSAATSNEAPSPAELPRLGRLAMATICVFGI